MEQESKKTAKRQICDNLKKGIGSEIIGAFCIFAAFIVTVFLIRYAISTTNATRTQIVCDVIADGTAAYGRKYSGFNEDKAEEMRDALLEANDETGKYRVIKFTVEETTALRKGKKDRILTVQLTNSINSTKYVKQAKVAIYSGSGGDNEAQDRITRAACAMLAKLGQENYPSNAAPSVYRTILRYVGYNQAEGACCDCYVHAVIAAACVDDYFANYGPDGIYSYCMNSNRWEYVGTYRECLANGELEPGDIICTERDNGHVAIYIGTERVQELLGSNWSQYAYASSAIFAASANEKWPRASGWDSRAAGVFRCVDPQSWTSIYEIDGIQNAIDSFYDIVNPEAN